MCLNRASLPLLCFAALATLLTPGPSHAQLVSPAQSRAVPMCAANQLSLGIDDENGNFNGMSHGGTLLVLRNLGTQACRVDAVPQLTFSDGLHELAVRGEMQGSRFMHPGPVLLPVIVAAGAELTSSLRWVSGEVYDKSTCISPTRVTLKLAGGTQATSFHGHLCGDATKGGVTYQMTRFAPDPVYTPAVSAR